MKYNFNLDDAENIVASDKKDKSKYYSLLFYVVAAFLVLIGACAAIAYFALKSQNAIYANISMTFLVVFVFALYFALKKLENDFTKSNRLYLTNKRFIVVSKDNLESVEFSDVKGIYYRIYAYKPTLYTTNKKFVFFCSDIFDVFEKFQEIYPEYFKEDEQDVSIYLSWGIMFFIFIVINVAKNIDLDTFLKQFAAQKQIQSLIQTKEQPQTQTKNQAQWAQCDFKNTNEYMKYIEKNIKANWNPNRGQVTETTRIVAHFTILRDGSIVNPKIVPSNSVMLNHSALDAINKTKLNCPLPNFLKGEKVPVEFTFDYNVVGKAGGK